MTLEQKLDNNITISIVKEICKRSFYQFFKLAWDSVESADYEDNWHIKYLCDELQKRFNIWEKNEKATPDELYDIIVNICPSASKSLIVSIMFPAWALLKNNKLKILNVTYSHAISEQLAGKRIKLLKSDFYRKISSIELESEAVNCTKIKKGGQIIATSIAGSITGLHFDILIGDDLNAPQSIFSKSDREQTKRFIKEVLPSRKTNVKRSYTIYLQQRLHHEDATGVLLEQKNKNYKHIVIKAIEDGKSFFEKRFPLEYFNDLKETLGSISFNAQYLQTTQEESGGIIKKIWLKYIESNEDKLIYFLDTAYGGQNADYNAIVGVIKKDNNIIIQKANINKMEFPELIKFLKSYIPPHAKVYIEGKASGKTIIQTLKKETNFNVIEIKSTVSKLQRKQSISPYFEAGRVFINKYIDHIETIEEQLIFDNTNNDDLLDVIMYAIEYILVKNVGNYQFGFV